MDKQKIYEIIKKLADDLMKDGSTFSRADLAYELKKLGIGNDSAEVAALVWQAYRFFNQDNNINKAFTGNSGKQTVVEEYRTKALSDDGNLESAFENTKANATNAENALIDLTAQAENAISADIVQSVGSLVQVLSGTNAISSIRDNAEVLVNRYAELIEAYNNAEDAVKVSVADFVTLRTNINEVYRKYASALIDVFGDRIKQVAPILFDFDKIAYLDTTAMQKNIQLEFNKIDDQCAVLIGEVKDSFQNTIQKSLNEYKLIGKGSKQLGLVMAGLNMVNHYLSAGQKASRLQGELSALKGIVKHDVTLINADRSRLLAINRTMSELYVPKAQAFFRHADRVMDNELKAILNAIYSAPEAKVLQEKRDALIAQCKELEATIADHQRNIDLYSRLIQDADQELNVKQISYKEAKSSKPSEPNVIKNMATFGNAKKNYNRAIFEWNAACAPLVNSYEDMEAERLLNSKELESHKKALEHAMAEYNTVKSKLESLNKEMVAKVNASDEAKMALLSHLKPMIGLLHLGKEIMESKLDQQLQQTASIKDWNAAIELPTDINNGIDQLAQSVKNGINNAFTESAETTAEDKAAQLIVSGGAAIMEAWLGIGKEELRLRKVNGEYDNELKHIQMQFKNYLAQVDNKSAYLNEVLKRVNTAKSNDELRDAVLELGEWDANSISEADWNAFLNGDKTLEI